MCIAHRHDLAILVPVSYDVLQLETEHSVPSLIHLDRNVTTIACIAAECIADEHCQVVVACDQSSSPSRKNGISMYATEADWSCVTSAMLQQGQRNSVSRSCRHQLRGNNSWSS
jgi:hypothetical protein